MPTPLPPPSPRHPSDATASPADSPLLCPLCNYNLTGLPTPQCPECGHRFEWSELTDPARQKLTWLFEHRPTPVAYLKTQLHLLRPTHFFRTLRPAHKLYPARILLFFAIVPSFLTVLVATDFALTARSLHLKNTAARIAAVKPMSPARLAQLKRWGWISATAPTSLSDADISANVSSVTTKAYLDSGYPVYGGPGFWQTVIGQSHAPARLLLLTTALLLSPTFAGVLVLGIMRQSFAMARIRPGHSLRSALYPADLFALFLLFAATFLLLTRSPLADFIPHTASPFISFVLPALLWLHRFHQSTRHYLALPRPLLISFVTLVISLLLTLILATRL